MDQDLSGENNPNTEPFLRYNQYTDGYEAKLHADQLTFEFHGKGDYSRQALCSHSIGSLATFLANQNTSQSDTIHRIAYFETLILATDPEPDTDISFSTNQRRLRALRRIRRQWNRKYESFQVPAVEATKENDIERVWRKQMQHFMQMHIARTRDTAQSVPSSCMEAMISEESVDNEVEFMWQDINQEIEHTIQVGFALRFRDTDSSTESLIAYSGSTGEIRVDDKVLDGPFEPFVCGDTVGCGVIINSRRFFFTRNGKLQCLFNAKNCYHLIDNFDMCDEMSENREQFLSDWERLIFGAVSLHSSGECVHAVFDPHLFRFDLREFLRKLTSEQSQLLSKFMRTHEEKVSEYAENCDVLSLDQTHAWKRNVQVPLEHDILEYLIMDYFTYSGYPRSAEKWRSRCTMMEIPSHQSAGFRYKIRRLIGQKKTDEAVALLKEKSMWPLKIDTNWLFLFHLEILCFLDILQSSDENSSSSWNVQRAIKYAHLAWKPSLLLHCTQSYEQVQHESTVYKLNKVGQLLSSTVTGESCTYLRPRFRAQVIEDVNRYIFFHDSNNLAEERDALLSAFFKEQTYLNVRCFQHNCTVLPDSASFTGKTSMYDEKYNTLAFKQQSKKQRVSLTPEIDSRLASPRSSAHSESSSESSSDSSSQSDSS